MTIVTILATVLLLHLFQNMYRLWFNIHKARSMGLPIRFVPIDQANILWVLFSVTHRQNIQRCLPQAAWNLVSLAIPGWELFTGLQIFETRNVRFHEGKDRSFALLGPRKLEIWTADPQAAHEVLNRIHDFHQPRGLELLLGKFGPNIFTTNGEQWKRHRKLVASAFNEHLARAVFEESIRHFESTFDGVLSNGTDKMSNMKCGNLFNKVTEMTFDVLVSAGIGNSFISSDEKNSPKITSRPSPSFMTYRQALHTLLDNAFGLAMLPGAVLRHWPSFVPGYSKAKKIQLATTGFRSHGFSLLDQGRVRLNERDGLPSSKADFLSILAHPIENKGVLSTSFTEEELISNLFVFSAGGFKTISGALEFALLLMTRFPMWQQWLIEEVDEIIPRHDGTMGSLEYTDVFPKAIRSLAFVLETLRLFSSASRFSRTTVGNQTVHTSTGNTLQLSAGSTVVISVVALHRLSSWRDINHQSDPAWYDSDPGTADENVFRPSRWINPPGSTSTHLRPAKGTFVPWSQGPRICPGSKMAQVEIVTVILCLLAKYNVRAVRSEHETAQDAEKRVDVVLQDVEWAGITSLKKSSQLLLEFSQRL